MFDPQTSKNKSHSGQTETQAPKVQTFRDVTLPPASSAQTQEKTFESRAERLLLETMMNQMLPGARKPEAFPGDNPEQKSWLQKVEQLLKNQVNNMSSLPEKSEGRKTWLGQIEKMAGEGLSNSIQNSLPVRGDK